MLTCETHGFLKGEQVRTVTIKGISYERCRECQREKDRRHAKAYREKNREYYARKKREHHAENPHMQVERTRRYRERIRRSKKPG